MIVPFQQCPTLVLGDEWGLGWLQIPLVSLHSSQYPNLRIKGTLSVVLSDPLCKDSNARFTTIQWEIIRIYHFSCKENIIDQIKVTLENRALPSSHEGSLEIRLTLPPAYFGQYVSRD